MRLRSDFWVAAWLRRCNGAGATAVLRRRGAAEAGAIFIVVDDLAGSRELYGPAPQSEVAGVGIDRLFVRLHRAAQIDAAETERLLARQLAFDSDIWIVEAEDRERRCFLDLAEPDSE